jgi:hypothetical protein
MIRKLLFAAPLFAFAFIGPAVSQGISSGAGPQYRVVASCGAPTYTVGSLLQGTMDANGNACGTGGGTGSGTVTHVGATFVGGLLSIAGSPITSTGTLAFTVAGTSGGIPYFNSSSTWLSSGVLATSALVIGGGAGSAPSTTTTGTGILTALGVNVGSAGAPVLFNGAGGTPSSLTLTNAGGLVASTGTTATGTPGSTTYLRGDNTWSTPAGSGGLTVGSTTITSGTSGRVEIDTSGVLQELPYGLTGNSTIVETTSGGLLTPSILPLATTAAFGGVKCDGTTITCTGGIITSTSSGSPLTTQDLLGNSVTNTATLSAGLGFTVSGSAGSATFTEAQLTNHAADSNYTMASTDKAACFSTTFTANRTLSLLATTSYTTGQEIVVGDCGAVGATYHLLVAPNGTDTINGVNASIQVDNTYGWYILKKVGTGAWSAISANIVPAFTPVTNNFLTGLSANGVWSSAQPAFTNISGAVAAAQMPGATVTFGTLTNGDYCTYTSSGTVINCNTGAGSGVSSVDIIAGTNVTVSGTCNSSSSISCTINSSGGGGSSVVYNSIGGCTLSNDGGTPNSILDIAACQAADSTNTDELTAAAFTKSTAGAWASGSGSNGMGNGLTIANSTWYHVCEWKNAGTTDYSFDTSATCANKPSGITGSEYRRLGSFKTDGSAHIIAYTQRGGNFIWTAPVGDLSSATLSSGTTATTLTVPLGVNVIAKFNYYCGSSLAIATVLFDPTAGSTTNGNNNYQCYTNAYVPSTVAFAEVGTNTSSQIDINTNGTEAGVALNTLGWYDYRGGN